MIGLVHYCKLLYLLGWMDGRGNGLGNVMYIDVYYLCTHWRRWGMIFKINPKFDEIDRHICDNRNTLGFSKYVDMPDGPTSALSEIEGLYGRTNLIPDPAVRIACLFDDWPGPLGGILSA